MCYFLYIQCNSITVTYTIYVNITIKLAPRDICKNIHSQFDIRFNFK